MLVLIALVVSVAASGCDSLPSLPGNPFTVTPTLVPTTVPTVTTAAPTAVPSPTPVLFTAFWVKNFRETEMWSGPTEGSGVVSFGMTSQQFCSFLVSQPEENGRLYVLNPYSQNYFWIDADAVGPVGEPEHKAGPKPPDQNCDGAIYDQG
jgi:hypothetical protein